MSDVETQINNKLEELHNHRGDGVATTTDLIRILEIARIIVRQLNAERAAVGGRRI